MYKTKLNSKIILSDNVISLIEGLKDGSISSTSFHNRKAYAKKTDKLLPLVELTIAWEIYNNNCKRKENV